jgi:hypothetical protein
MLFQGSILLQPLNECGFFLGCHQVKRRSHGPK